MNVTKMGVLFIAAIAASPSQTLTNDVKINQEQIKKHEIGKTWSGVNTNISAASDKHLNTIIAYYNSEKLINVVKLDKKGNIIDSTTLHTNFNGWDSHNYLSVAISNDDYVHISGNMHASPLIYARGDLYNLKSIKYEEMIGESETRTTYPKFIYNKNSDLLFIYRDGKSGDGRWLVNKWTGGHWVRINEIFSNKDKLGKVSAYPSEFIQDSNGRYHVAVVWRRSKDVSSNYSITYASTLNFENWEISNNIKISEPLSPHNMQTIANVGMNNGLVNNIRLLVSPDGNPLILYTRYTESGKNGVYASTLRNQVWHSNLIAESQQRKEIQGGGSLSGLPIGSFGTFRNGRLEVHVSFQNERTRHFLLDPISLRTIPYVPQPSTEDRDINAYLRSQAKGLVDVTTLSSPIRRNGVDGPITGYLKWFAQKANGDKPRDCTIEAPAACSPPPSPLLWVPISK